MTTIEFYKPKAVSCKLNFPTRWDELTIADLKRISIGIQRNLSKQWLALQLVGLRAKSLPTGWQHLLHTEQAALELTPLVDQLMEENNLTLNPIPAYGIIKKFYGPADAFNDITVGEYEDCEHFFLSYQKDSNSCHLTDLMSILWRRRIKGLRKPYTQHIQGKSSFSIRPSEATLHLVYLWYAGCRSRLPKLFPNVFDAPDGEPGRDDMMAITTLIHYGAGVKNGTRDQIRKTLLKEFLYECELAAIQQMELEQELQKMKQKK